MKKIRLLIILALLAGALLLSSCVGGAGVGPTTWPGVLASDEVAYLAQGNHVYAINLNGGTLKWKYPADKPTSTTFYSAPVLAGTDQVLAASYDHKLYSLDTETGSVKWIFGEAKDLYIASPLVTEKGIYAPNADGTLYAINFDGQEIWSFASGQHLWGTPISDEECGCIYLPGMDHKFYALNADDGKVLWETEDLGGALIAQPTYSDGVLYIGTFANQVLALDAADGSTLWTFEAGGWIYGSAVVKEDLVIVGDLKNNLYALDRADGTQIWNKTLDGPVYATPLVKDESIYVTTGTELVYAFNLDGTSAWSQDVIDKAVIQGSVVDGGELILVPTSSVEQPLVALNPSGTIRWVFSVPK